MTVNVVRTNNMWNIRGISKSIRHFIRHFIRHLTILCVTWPSYASLDHLIRHSTILSVTQQFCQDVDFINKFDTIWSSKWLWSIIFFSESGYLDDRTFQHMHVTVKALQDLRVFAHWRYMDLLVWLLCICQTQQSAFADKWYQRFVWNIAGFLPKQFVYFPTPIICICRHVIYPHVSEMVPWLFSSLLIIGIHSSSLFSLIPSYRVMDGDG